MQAEQSTLRQEVPAIPPLIGVLLVPVIVHSIFHLLDWAVWGLGMDPTIVRAILLPAFQDATPLGLAVHAGVNLATLAALAILLLMVRKLRGLGDAEGSEGP